MRCKGFVVPLLLAVLSLFAADGRDAWNATPEEILEDLQSEFGYETWPGRDGTIRRTIELSASSLSGYGLQLAPGFNDSTMFIKVPLSERDSLKIGRVQIGVYRTIEEAQRGLVEFLLGIQSNIKPPRLTAQEFPIGDVAFGERREGVFFGAFTRANVRIVLQVPTDVAEELAGKVDGAVEEAPAWAPGDPRPRLIISEEFLRSFFLKTP